MVDVDGRTEVFGQFGIQRQPRPVFRASVGLNHYVAEVGQVDIAEVEVGIVRSDLGNDGFDCRQRQLQREISGVNHNRKIRILVQSHIGSVGNGRRGGFRILRARAGQTAERISNERFHTEIGDITLHSRAEQTAEVRIQRVVCKTYRQHSIEAAGFVIASDFEQNLQLAGAEVNPAVKLNVEVRRVFVSELARDVYVKAVVCKFDTQCALDGVDAEDEVRQRSEVNVGTGMTVEAHIDGSTDTHTA